MTSPSSIDNLPVELLSYIFILGTYTSSNEKRWYEFGEEWDIHRFRTDLPTTVAQVCRHWRQVALSTLELWTNICVTKADIVKSDEDPRYSAGQWPGDARSPQSSPIDILIDARDPQWDFTEPEGSEDQLNWKSFLPVDARGSLAYLLKYVSRWRSLIILSDIYAPMHAILDCLSKPHFIQTYSGASNLSIIVAPLLESLTFMRCNEYACYSPIFYPENMRDPAPLPLVISQQDGNLFSCIPRLKRLLLSGVHLDWSRLPPPPDTHIPSPCAAIKTLELSYHCRDVMPKLHQFVRLLEACPQLSKLILQASGPIWDPENIEDSDILESRTVALSNLRTLCVGYVDSHVSMQVLKMLVARELENLELEDAGHPISSGEDDATDLINWLGGTRDNGSLRTDAIPFPALEQLRLRRLQLQQSEPLANLLSKLRNLQALSIDTMSLPAIQSLKPRSSPPAESRHICPNLKRLHVTGIQEQLDVVEEILADRTAEGLFLEETRLELFGQGRDIGQEWEADMMALSMSVGGDMDVFFDSVDMGSMIPSDEDEDEDEDDGEHAGENAKSIKPWNVSQFFDSCFVDRIRYVDIVGVDVVR
ncbi:hypothetical protein GLOTRDRAFT_141002 [Gloeophyllum trabeum ATCC 11539]|uniref:F-box domain-containing protein n=1 Tax=Gloeophyllum trabeum (strain ATCC 11539 / FP-39264 / Madison 617) TaxID=670483 RepID=S7RBL1_GLOTA|nr:uncharacterized protein GLOTRDRAFT_141002 [Gloeophyllum trabeum ATCC 11539]EPQ51630.1 hypothetical protein GLOTRDRAFT_141002 [Gloeophyllum trabeum ATCC 11539]